MLILNYVILLSYFLYLSEFIDLGEWVLLEDNPLDETQSILLKQGDNYCSKTFRINMFILKCTILIISEDVIH